MVLPVVASVPIKTHFIPATSFAGATATPSTVAVLEVDLNDHTFPSAPFTEAATVALPGVMATRVMAN